jgi:hypothetical protein
VGVAWEGFESSCVQRLVQIESEAGEIAKGCVLVRRWRGDGRLRTKEGRSTALLWQICQAIGESLVCFEDMRKGISVCWS